MENIVNRYLYFKGLFSGKSEDDISSIVKIANDYKLELLRTTRNIKAVDKVRDKYTDFLKPYGVLLGRVSSVMSLCVEDLDKMSVREKYLYESSDNEIIRSFYKNSYDLSENDNYNYIPKPEMISDRIIWLIKEKYI